MSHRRKIAHSYCYTVVRAEQRQSGVGCYEDPSSISQVSCAYALRGASSTYVSVQASCIGDYAVMDCTHEDDDYLQTAEGEST